jgi:membrane-bound lytic murein transglycosylase F
MKRNRGRSHGTALLAGLIFWIVGCGCHGGGTTLDRIRASGKITLLTRNNANCYYLYRDKPAGFEYELAKAFSTSLGVELEILVVEWNDLFDMLNSDRADFLAAGVTITPPRAELVDFSVPYMAIQQQVIVHRNNRSLRRLSDLRRRTVHVRENTTYHERLKALNREEGLDIRIISHDDVPTEELIRQVAEKEIGITVADSNIALLNRRYYPDIAFAFPLQEGEHLGWAVGKGDRALLAHIDAFFLQAKEDGTYRRLYERYYGDVDVFDYVDLKRFHRRIERRLPEFLPAIQEASADAGFDWRLISAVIYQESHLNPRAQSHTGVRGLMQVTRETAAEMGIDNRLDPDQSIRAGVGYLKNIFDRWDALPKEARLRFSLASYNIGIGHVRDAQELAESMGMNPRSWASMETVLPLLRIKKYYRQTRHGYARGTEPVRFVKRVFIYYDILKKKDIPGFQRSELTADGHEAFDREALPL